MMTTKLLCENKRRFLSDISAGTIHKTGDKLTLANFEAPANSATDAKRLVLGTHIAVGIRLQRIRNNFDISFLDIFLKDSGLDQVPADLKTDLS